MSFEMALQQFTDCVATAAPAFVLVVARIGALFAMTPFFGSARIPRRVRVMLVLMLSFAMAGSITAPPPMPGDLATLVMALGGEIIFGIAMGMIVSFVFIAAQWAGEIMGTQMGLQIAQTFDPQFGASSSLVGDMQFMLCLIIFISPIVDGPTTLLRGVHASFTALPLMSVGLDHSLFNIVIQLFAASAMLALQLAAPMLVTMLIVDVALGVLGKTMPQLNIMSAGLSIRALVGMVVLVFGLHACGDVLENAVIVNTDGVAGYYATPPTN